MGNVILKVIGYIIIRYILFLGILFSVGNNVKMVKPSDLQKGEDWFMFLWLFGLPVLVEALFIGLPMLYGINKLVSCNHKSLIYLLFIVLFVLEFSLAYWIYGVQSAFMKIVISIILFILIFWKRLF